MNLQGIAVVVAVIVLAAAIFSPGIGLAEENLKTVTLRSVTDPVGDDYGPGTYKYPTNEAFTNGSLDLTKFELLRYEEGNTTKYIGFRFTFSTLGENYLNTTYGWSVQAIQVYVTAVSGGVGRMDTFGLNAVVRPVDAWQFAVIVEPYNTSNTTSLNPLRGPVPPSLIFENGTIVTDNITTVVNTTANYIEVKIPAEYLRNYLSYVAAWRFIVAVSGFDPRSPGGIMKVSASTGESVIGGAPADALNAFVAPKIMDLLNPENGTQEQMLGSYLPDSGEPVVLAAYPAATGMDYPKPPETVTVTTTATYISTTTKTVTTSTVQAVEYFGPSTYALAALLVILLGALAYVLKKGR